MLSYTRSPSTLFTSLTTPLTELYTHTVSNLTLNSTDYRSGPGPYIPSFKELSKTTRFIQFQYNLVSSRRFDAPLICSLEKRPEPFTKGSCNKLITAFNRRNRVKAANYWEPQYNTSGSSEVHVRQHF